ncbi:MAG: raffinose/stachyose/melibiose transport system substrate-binding protein, partial [Microbacteriaceae bacterium]|nr:raffinose/stachyose/melibiose transport system substrate-binding protein [Microbacteriaceae bacterium]
MQFTRRPKAALRSFAVLAAVGLSALSLTACSSGGGSGGGTGGGTANSKTVGTVSWWGWTPVATETTKAYIEAFNKKYPKIKVNFKLVAIPDWQAAITPALRSNGGPDVFDNQPGAYVDRYKSFTEDLTPAITKALGSDWKSKLAPAGVKPLTLNGKLQAVNVGANYAGMLWINKGLFDKYGVKPPTTLDEWVKACETFKAKKQGCFVQGAAGAGFNKDTLQAIANSVEPGLWSKASRGEAKWNSPGIVKTFDIWHQLFTRGIMQPGAVGYQQYPDANNDFLTGKYAMVMMGTWYTQYTTERAMSQAQAGAGVSNAKTFPIVPIDFPNVGGNEPAMFGDSDLTLSVSKKAKNKSAAIAFATWMATSKEAQQIAANQLDAIPGVIGVQADFGAIKLVDEKVQKAPVEALLQKLTKVTEPRFAEISQDVQDAVFQAGTSVATGKKTPQQAADTLQKAAETA